MKKLIKNKLTQMKITAILFLALLLIASTSAFRMRTDTDTNQFGLSGDPLSIENYGNTFPFFSRFSNLLS